MTQVSDTIIARVQKLLALSNNNSNVNEASAAAAAAQKIIEQYNLDMAQIAASNGEETISQEEISREYAPLYQGKNAITWKGSLADCISRSNNCRVFLTGGDIHIVGKKTNVELSRFLFTYVSNEIERLCSIAMKVNAGGGKSYSNNFKLGAVSAIRDNLKKSQAEVRNKYEGTAAMVIINNEAMAVDHWLNTNMRLRQKAASHTSYNPNARNDGYAAGSTINLNRAGLNSGSGVKLLNR